MADYDELIQELGTHTITDINLHARLFYYGEESLMMVVSDETLPREKEPGQEMMERIRKSVEEEFALPCRLLLVIWEAHDEMHISCISTTGRVRALDFLNVFLWDIGLVKGNDVFSSGWITDTVLDVGIEELDLKDRLEYFKLRTLIYFKECVIIDAISYGPEHESEIRKLPVYYKKQIPWYFVRSSEITAPGNLINIRSLENESGMNITSSDDIYIMIGNQGEVYYMDRKKFESSYEPTDEVLDIFAQVMAYMPEVQVLPEVGFVSIDEIARTCYPKRGCGIYARQLEGRTKVFPVYDREHYFLGKKGDFLVVRTDDISDIYIIQEKIFFQTYEKGDNIEG